MHSTQKEKAYHTILEAIEKSKSMFIVVEGRKDLQALIDLGFKRKNIFVLNNGNSIEKNIEKIIESSKRNQVCILTDFDSEGKKLYRMIKRELSKNGVKVNNKLRLQLLKEKISHIEGIATFLKHYEFAIRK
ncbi:MAG: toprim domain-containing protein [Candidatus Pacearchaeota archaeon]